LELHDFLLRVSIATGGPYCLACPTFVDQTSVGVYPLFGEVSTSRWIDSSERCFYMKDGGFNPLPDLPSISPFSFL
jgi:hypothetical protein